MSNSSNKTSTDPDEKEDKVKKKIIKFRPTPGHDPRFQQTNQSLRCYVMYTDFYRCEKILGENEKACQWFKDTFQALCPKAWIEQWDSLRALNPPKFHWHKERTQGKFPGRSYAN